MDVLKLQPEHQRETKGRVTSANNVWAWGAENLEHTRLAERARVHQMPVARYLGTAHPEEKYAIILMDPPYADPEIEGTIRAVSASGLLADQGLLIVGHSPRVTLADDYEPLHRRKFRRLGDSCFSIYEVSAEPTTP